MGPDTKSALKATMKQVADVKADGENVVFTLKGGNADFPYVLAEHRLSIMPAKDNGEVDWQSGVGTGPYMLEEYKPGETTRAKRNPNYFRDTWFDNVELLSIIDPTARTNALALEPPRCDGSLRSQDGQVHGGKTRDQGQQGHGLRAQHLRDDRHGTALRQS